MEIIIAAMMLLFAALLLPLAWFVYTDQPLTPLNITIVVTFIAAAAILIVVGILLLTNQ